MKIVKIRVFFKAMKEQKSLIVRKHSKQTIDKKLSVKMFINIIT